MCFKRCLCLLACVCFILLFPGFSAPEDEDSGLTIGVSSQALMGIDAAAAPLPKYVNLAWFNPVTGAQEYVASVNVRDDGTVVIPVGTVFSYVEFPFLSELSAGSLVFEASVISSRVPSLGQVQFRGDGLYYAEDFKWVKNFSFYIGTLYFRGDASLQMTNFSIFLGPGIFSNITWTASDRLVLNRINPPVPGEEDSKGWLSGFFDTIFGGITKIVDGIVNLPSSIANAIGGFFTELGNRIGAALSALGTFVVDGIGGLFLPREGYFEGLFSRLQTFFSERFGFLFYPFDLVITVIGYLMNLPETAPSIVLPHVEFMGHVLFEQQAYTFDFISDPAFSPFFQMYMLVVKVILLLGFVDQLRQKVAMVMEK